MLFLVNARDKLLIFRQPVLKLTTYYAFISFIVVCVVLSCSFTFWVLWCDVRYDFRINTIFGSSLPQFVCRGCFCLVYVICVCLRIVVSNTYCVEFFLRLVLPVSLDCLFLIAPWCSLTFIAFYIYLFYYYLYVSGYTETYRWTNRLLPRMVWIWSRIWWLNEGILAWYV